MARLLPLTGLGRWFARPRLIEAPPAPSREAMAAPKIATPPAPAPIAVAAPRVMLFIDEPNLARSLSEVRSQGKDLDYRKLRDHFAGDTPLVAAAFYTGYVDSQIGMRGFFRKLADFGYEVIQVRSKQFRDGSVKNADPDIKIVTDLLVRVADYDEAVLVSGDGDFADTVRHLLRLGKRVKVVSMRSRLAQELRESGAEIIFLEGIIQDLLMERHMRSGPGAPPRSS